MEDRWWIVFYLGKREIAAEMAEFLKERLNEAYSFEVRVGEVVVGNLRDKNDAWKVALFIKHNCGIRNPRYVIEARNANDKITWMSNCSSCREGEGQHHDEHG